MLDPFCGCGTAVHAAQKTNRRWIGIDITHLSVSLIEYRMQTAFNITPDVEGLPKSLEGAEELAKRDPHQFQIWAATRIKNIKPNEKKGPDRGIDGHGNILIGHDDDGNPVYKKVIVSVKAGQNIGVGMIDALAGVVKREGASFGIFVCVKKPTRAMIREVADRGMVSTPIGVEYPRIQIYTMRDYFDGRQPKLPDLSPAFLVAQIEKMESGRQVKLN